MVRTTPDDASDEKLLNDIERHGWHNVGIAADALGPAYVFSVGMFQTLQHPEICIFGLNDTNMMSRIVNEVGELIRRGQTFSDGSTSDELLEGFPCVFRSITPDLYPEYFGYARWYYEGNAFPMLQCVWPDLDGRFPWEPDFNSSWLWQQPVMANQTPWPFEDPKDTATLTTRHVNNGTHPILLVTHDEDGDWQFLCGTTNSPDDAVVICLADISKAHPSVNELHDLPRNWMAERESETHPWKRSPQTNSEEEET